MKTVLDEIKQERKEQVEKHGFTAEVDDERCEEHLLWKALAVFHCADTTSTTSLASLINEMHNTGMLWRHAGAIMDKPKRERLIVGAALIVAEIERMDRNPK